MIPARFAYPSPGFTRYWTKGRGRHLLRQAETIPDEQEIRERIPLLFGSDTLADTVIREIYLKQGFREADRLLSEAMEPSTDPATLPECIRELIQSMRETPEWLDRNKVEAGAAFCRRAGVLAFLVLRNYCLMGGYESAAINKPLIFTEALKKGAAKRIAETTEFWVNCTGEGALETDAIGFKHAVKVRLMHAYARVSVDDMPDWETTSWGTPINHWDMIATNLGFSIVFLDGLNNLGIRATKAEEEGLFHFWKYTGFLLGIPAEHLPDTRAAAIRELYCWTMSQPPADDDTRALARSLMLEPLTSAFPFRNWQRKLAVKLHLGYNHLFLGRASCAAMGLPATGWRIAPYLVKWLRTAHEIPVLLSTSYRKFTEKRGRKKQLTITRLILDTSHRPGKTDQK